MAMQIAVLGLGRFGTQLVRTLSAQGNEVLAVDQSEAEVQRVAEIAARAAIADITDLEALRDLGVTGMDIGVVGTAELEASVLATMNLQSLGVSSIYAKARSERHATILRRIGAQRVVQPEKEGGERFAHLIRVKAAADYLTLSAEYGIGVYEAPAQLVGKPLEELDAQAGTRRLLMVVRNDQVQLNPVRSQVIEAADRLVFAGGPAARQHDRSVDRSFVLVLVAGAGFEPATFGL
jgi:trk system potassium uptake protein TrkA